MSAEQNILRTQVLIAGAGPTGLSMAVQLLRYNIDFIIIEKREKTTQLSKAVVVQARSLEIFEELGLAQKAVKTGQVTTALNLFYKGKQRANVNLSGLGEGLSRFPFALSLEQSKTEKLLADYLSEHNKTIQWQSEFSHFEQRENGVTAYYNDKDGQQQAVEADYLVGCDGAHSLVRHQLGLKFEGDTVPKIFYVADVTLKSSVINKSELFIFLVKKGFVIFFPMEGKGHYRVIGILPGVKDSDPELKFEDIEDTIKQDVACPLEFDELRWFSSYKVHSRKAVAFMNGRCFIAGDAAHIHTPAGGQGMNTGIQDAYNLAWKLACTLKGETNAGILETYNTERVENAEHLLHTTDRMFDVMAGTNQFLNFIRLSVFPLLAGLITKNAFVKRKIFPLISQTSIAYPNSALTVKSSIGKVSAGMRMPYFVFPDGKNIFNYLAEPCFKILFFGNAGDNNLKNSDLKLTVKTYNFKEIPAALFGNETDFYILLRPDNHISYVGKSLETCEEFLKRISG